MARGTITDRRDADDGEEITFTADSISKIARYDGAKADRKKASEDRAMKATKAASAAAQKTPFPVATRVGGQPVAMDDRVFLTRQDREDFNKRRETEVLDAFAKSPQGKRAAAMATPKRKTPMFAVGAKGAGVSDLQEFLKEGGFYTGEIDSDFGGQTKAAVEAYQRSKGLTADGMVGTNTLAAIKADMQQDAVAAPSMAEAPAQELVVAGQTVEAEDPGGLEQDLIRRLLGMDPKKKQEIMDAVASSMRVDTGGMDTGN
jgi:hypothetical protein